MAVNGTEMTFISAVTSEMRNTQTLATTRSGGIVSQFWITYSPIGQPANTTRMGRMEWIEKAVLNHRLRSSIASASGRLWPLPMENA
jgi:hypothetical protein